MSLSIHSAVSFSTGFSLDQAKQATCASQNTVLENKVQMTRWAKAPHCRLIKVDPCCTRSTKSYHHQPYDVVDYDFDYNNFLSRGDKIASWEALAGSKKLPAHAKDNVLKVWVSTTKTDKRVMVRINSTFGVSKEITLVVR